MYLVIWLPYLKIVITCSGWGNNPLFYTITRKYITILNSYFNSNLFLLNSKTWNLDWDKIHLKSKEFDYIFTWTSAQLQKCTNDVVNTVYCKWVNIIWLKTTKDYLQCFKSHNLFGLIFGSILEAYQASNFPLSSNHLFCAIALKWIQTHQTSLTSMSGHSLLRSLRSCAAVMKVRVRNRQTMVLLYIS